MLKYVTYEATDELRCTISVNCSFPFTYNGGLYYRCIENMTDVSTAEQPFACINVNATPVVCDSPGRLIIFIVSVCVLSEPSDLCLVV